MHATVRVEKGSCVNPPANVRRHDEIATLIGALRRRFPDRVFRPLGDIDGHHSLCPFSWQLAPKPGGESIAVGLDVAAR